MKKLFLVLIVSFTMLFLLNFKSSFAQCGINETKVRVIVRTDSYGYETFWQLKNGNTGLVLKSGGNTIVFPGGQQAAASGNPGAYPNNTIRRDSLCIANYTPLKFIIYDDYSDGLTGSGYYNVEVEGVVIANGKSFGAADSVLFSVPLPEIDLAVNNVVFGDKATIGNHAIEGELKNVGTTAINSFNLNWSVNGTTTRAELYDNVNLAPNAFLKFTHKFGWQAETLGNNNLKVWVNNVNGANEDEFTGNDTLQKNIDIFQNNRVVLLESWTNASCGPCAQYMPAVEDKLSITKNYVVSVSYHSDYPGYDIMNTHNPQQAELRGNYYSVNSYPTWFIDGDAVANFVTDQALYDRSLVPATFEITEPMVTIIGDTLYASANAINNNPLNGNYRGHAVVVEKIMDYTNGPNPGSNGIKKFDWVMKNMLTGTGGVAIGTTLPSGNSAVLEGKWKIANVQDTSELAVVFWVQNNQGKEVQQAAIAHVESEPDYSEPVDTQTAIIEVINNSIIKVFPNPASNELFVDLNNVPTGNIQISIFNLIGQVITELQTNVVAQNENLFINTSSLENGMYLVKITGKEYQATAKVTISK